jgi:hypothetical protein
MERTAWRQGIALFLLAIGALAWKLAPGHEPEPFVGWLTALGMAGVVVEAGIVIVQRGRERRAANELIEAGFRPGDRADLVSDAVRVRIEQLTGERTRRALARGLREELRLAQHPPRPWPRALPPARRFIEHADLIILIAATIEHAPCDPRALILLDRLLRTPDIESCWKPSDHHDPNPTHQSLHQIAGLLELPAEQAPKQ